MKAKTAGGLSLHVGAVDRESYQMAHFLSSVHAGINRTSALSLPPVILLGQKFIHTQTLLHLVDFDPEDGGSMYRRNISNTGHIHMVQRPKNRTNVKSEPPWKSKFCKKLY
jgi:hypothetical protein